MCVGGGAQGALPEFSHGVSLVMFSSAVRPALDILCHPEGLVLSRDKVVRRGGLAEGGGLALSKPYRPPGMSWHEATCPVARGSTWWCGVLCASVTCGVLAL
jgi:hypothetical protein